MVTSTNPMDIERAEKSVEDQAEHSLQPRAKGTNLHYGGLAGVLQHLVAGSYRISPWWSPQRDKDLIEFTMSSDHLSGARSQLSTRLETVPVRVLPRDNTLKAHSKQAEDFTILLNEEAELGQGWVTFIGKWLQDFWNCDNGAFFEVTGNGDPRGPIEGRATGLLHLDSTRCARTGDYEYPVVYTPPKGPRIKYHYTRVGFASDMPSSQEEMLGVGFCAISRAAQNGQFLIDMGTYWQEKLGSRPKRGMLVGKGISTDAILDAMTIADEQMDSRNLKIFSQFPVIGDIDPNAALEILNLVSLPDGFDQETATRLGMFSVALAFNVPIRWIWPAATSGATKADAMYQHIAGLGGGLGKALQVLTVLLGGDPRGSRHGIGKFLPPHLKIEFDFQDDEQDRMRAEVQGKRATTRQVNLETGMIDSRVGRVQMLESGDINQQQFDYLEREDGRLPGGESVLSLFHVTKEPFFSWLDMGVENPLATSANDAMQMLGEINVAAITVQDALANSSNATTRKQAEESLAALNKLKSLYAPLAQQSVMSSLQERLGYSVTPRERSEDEKLPEPEGSGIEPVEGEKSFDYAVGAGEIIGGELARDPQGQFINAQQLMEMLQAGMMDRLRGGRSSGGGAVNSASAKRGANRADMAARLGIDPALLEGLAGMTSGDTPFETEQLLVAQGLAKLNSDGTISMSAAGRSLLSAANSGNVDKAEEANARRLEQQQSGGGGKAPKPTAEQRAREHEQRQEQERLANLEKSRAELSERLPGDDFDALVRFDSGKDLSLDESESLARQGLVEIDENGNARMTREGQRVIASALKGDVRRAKDALSAANEKVLRTVEKARSLRVKADEVLRQAVRETGQLEAYEVALKRNVEEFTAWANETITTLTEQATQYETEAAAYQDMIDNAPNPQAREEAMAAQDRLLAQAKAARDELQQVSDHRQQTLQNFTKASVEARERYEERQRQLAAYANDLQKQMERLLESVGGGTIPAQDGKNWLTKILERVGLKKEVVTPIGQRLPDFDKTEDEFTEELMAASYGAIKGWNDNADLPSGVLTASEAGNIELGVALETDDWED